MELVQRQTMEVPVPRLAWMPKIVVTASGMKDAIFGHNLAYSYRGLGRRKPKKMLCVC